MYGTSTLAFDIVASVSHPTKRNVSAWTKKRPAIVLPSCVKLAPTPPASEGPCGTRTKFCEKPRARLSIGMPGSLPSDGLIRLPPEEDELGALDGGMAESEPGV